MNMNNVKEIMPLYSMVMVEIYDENPYERKETETGLRITNDLRENEDTGMIEKSEFYVKTAKVIEAGPDCKYVRAGDDVLIDTRSIRPIRFMDNIFWNIAEPNLVAVINEGLSERFKK